MDTNDTEILKEISNKLDILIAVNAIQNKERDDQIRVLVNLGYTNKNISEFTGIPKGTVDMVRANLKK